MRAAALLLLFAAGCGDDEPAFSTPAECNPLGGMNCITPWPSAIYEVEDQTTATGMRLDIPAGALPTSTDGYPIDPAPLNVRDGFSAAAPIITAFGTGVDPSNLVPYADYPASITDASPTVIIDMVTGERVLHFAEIDARVPEEPAKQALYLRPAVRLEPGRRYAVAIRTTLRAKDGGPLPVPEGYRALLDGADSGHALFERVRPRYDAIFAALAEQGIDRNELVAAWDFTTASDESLRRDLIAARDAAIDAIGDAGANLSYTVEDDAPFEDGSVIARVIHGTFEAPLFLTQGGAYQPGTQLARGADGLPELQGMYDIVFDASVPACAESAPAPVPIIVYGHGLMGNSDEVTHGASRKTADRLCAVLVGTKWRGMSDQDLPQVAAALNDANKGPWIFETLVQGIVNMIVLEHIARGPMAESLFVDAGGASLVDPTKVYYYGNSQGGIFGGTFMAYDPFVTRGVLGVPAINYSMMLERSGDWPIYRTILIGAYPDPLDVTILINLMQLQWDTTDPVGSVTAVLEGGIPGVPPKQLLLHEAIADVEVSNVATEYQARTLGIPTLAPAVYEPFGVPAATGPLDSALVLWDGGYPPIPTTNTPPEENDAHQLPRNQEAALRQMQTFYETGEIVHTCGDGPCDCTTSACD
jgi:hypothetical protein